MNTEQRIAELEREIVELKRGIYNFSDKQVWTKALALAKLIVGTQNLTDDGTNLVTSGPLKVNGVMNATGVYKANGVSGVSTSFATTGSFTVTVTNGIITSVV